MTGTAELSPCGKYRYSLTRQVDHGRPVSADPRFRSRVLFVGVNPSTADASQNDPTIRKMLGFARRWGYDEIEVVNLFALRATDVRELRKHYLIDRPSGPAGEQRERELLAVRDAAYRASAIVVCWGAREKLPKELRSRITSVVSALQRTGGGLRCLGRTSAGDPKHPLMLAYDTPWEVYS